MTALNNEMSDGIEYPNVGGKDRRREIFYPADLSIRV